jgi:uncharacterized membrane protein
VTHPTESSTGLSSRTAAALAYGGWWITGLIFWAVEQRDVFVRFHAAQAVAAFGFVALLIAVFFVLAALSLSFLPAAFSFFAIAALVTWVLGIFVWVFAMSKAASGAIWRIPGAAELADWMMLPRRA